MQSTCSCAEQTLPEWVTAGQPWGPGTCSWGCRHSNRPEPSCWPRPTPHHHMTARQRFLWFFQPPCFYTVQEGRSHPFVTCNIGGKEGLCKGRGVSLCTVRLLMSGCLFNSVLNSEKKKQQYKTINPLHFIIKYILDSYPIFLLKFWQLSK